MLIIVWFFLVHLLIFCSFIAYKTFKEKRCPCWFRSSSSIVSLELRSKSHLNYEKFVSGNMMIHSSDNEDVSEQENQLTFTSPGASLSPIQATSSTRDLLSDLEAQPGASSSTVSTSKGQATSTLSISKDSGEKEKLSRRNGKVNVDTKVTGTTKKKIPPDKTKVGFEDKRTAPETSKGKFGPKTVPKGGLKRTPEVQVIETDVLRSDAEKPDLDPDVKTQPRSRYVLHRQSTTSIEPLTSNDSAVQTTEADVHILSGSSDRRYAKKSIFSSLESVKSLTDDGPDLPLRYSRIDKHPLQHYGRIPGVIDPRVRYDILHSVPVCSQEVKPKPRRREGPSVHWSNHVEYERQQPVSDNFSETPPSPAPSTPQHLRKRSLPQRPQERLYDREERRTEWSYEEYQKLSVNRQRRATFGPRFVAIQRAAGPRANKYELYDRTPPASVRYKRCFYGAATPTRPFHSYIDPDDTVPEVKFRYSDTFVNKIYNQYNNSYFSPETAMMNPLEDHERKIIIEFCHLLEKSKQLFNGLRELPQYGHKQWSLYFGRTFDIYTRLWKYQQQHRSVLDSKYGMKRWQIGEIASKIGQLYYHFYLRTSETAYLNEAFSFYYAIRGRCYYTKANKEDKCELMVKKLRYYARFIVVCLLLNKMKLVKELIKELERQIIEYGNTYDPDDQVEWTVVVDEVKAFIHAEPVVSVVNTDNQTMILSHRLSPLMTPPVERSSQMNLTLQEIVIVGSSSQQVKFSELTMDMFRMLQTLEREPSGDIQHIFDESPRQRFMAMPRAQSQEGGEPGQKMPNPHKYLLFKPSPTQMLVYLASASNDLPPNGALLLYISADGYVSQNGKHADDGTWGYDLGGLITTSKNDIYRECTKDPKSSTSSKYKELQCFYPGDLYPYTRRPLFLIVDSDNSYAFQNLPRHFGQPLVILMSPLDLPPSYHDPRRQGSLFTLFLHSPLEGLCYCCDLSSVTVAMWDRAQMLMDTFMAEASSILVRSRIDPTYIAFMGDDFFRLLLVRFVFCEAVLRLHRLFRGRSHHTRCSPVLPEELFEHPTLVHIILDIAGVLQIRNHIQDPQQHVPSNNAPIGPIN